MTPPLQEPIWKRWLDRVLVLDVFVVLGGRRIIEKKIVGSSQGIEGPMRQFQRLWEPLFTPAIGLLIASALINGCWSWWQRRVQRQATDNGN